MAKNIVLCFDGTGDWAGFDATNVLQIFEGVPRDENHLAFYDGGVGTLNDPGKLTNTGRITMRLLDLALATGLRDKVLAGYLFLVNHYEPGDRIYMFGFSRGAYTARVLCGLIHNLGLLRKEQQNLALYLWQTFSDFKIKKQFDEVANRIRTDFSRPPVEIEFLGLCDTVSSVGILQRFKTFPNTDLNPSVKTIRHAVSIDERRNGFPESLFSAKSSDLIELWFPGVHRDVGGGYLPKDSALPNVVRDWLVTEAAKSELHLTLTDPGLTPKPPILPGTDPYVPAGLYPMRFWDSLVHDFRAIWPNFKHTRPIPSNALIHKSVEGLLEAGYRPRNLPKKPVYYDPKGANQPPPPTYHHLTLPKPSLNDLLRLILGSGVIFALALGIFNPFETAWPALAKWLFWCLFLANLLRLFITGYLDRWLKFDTELPFPLIGVAIAAWVTTTRWEDSHFWLEFAIGAGAGLVLWALAQLPPKPPILSPGRVLGMVGQAWVSVALSFYFADCLLKGVARLAPTWAHSVEGGRIALPYLSGVFLAFVTVWQVTMIWRDRLEMGRAINRPLPPH